MAAIPQTIIAYTADDDRYAALRVAAEEAAREAHARLILYDIDAAGMFAAPLPNKTWSGEGADELFGEVLTADDLERAGRHSIAGQVRGACEAGIEAYGWLPSHKGAAALADYADKQHADLIMVPKDMEEPGLLDRLRGATLEKAEKDLHRPLAVVDHAGRVEYR